MINKDMGAIPNRESASDDCGQEAKKMLSEVRRIIYRLELEDIEPIYIKRHIFDEGSDNLRDFMVERIGRKDEYQKLVDILEEEVQKEAIRQKEEQDKAKMWTSMAEAVREAVRKELDVINAYPRMEGQIVKRGIECFYCGRSGHIARNCFQRKDKDGKNNLNKRLNSYHFEEDNKVFKHIGCSKRIRLR
ncbi:Pol protein [Vairimorpha apis BRL 01]|uniref:Pol protein n=1 Tax=Vairimorpha apis BRL 01 TaxID=1037528 RepID=T0MF99_9MICR|nr:Pol protein [Vairimorpha apis BRL 01]